jgi:sedoheptulokinase
VSTGLALGIDCGTGKVAVALVRRDGTQVHTSSAPHRAELPTAAGRSEQDPARILASAEALVAGLPAEMRGAVAAIGLTGQMHGVLLHRADGRPCSPLVTWQDRRVLDDPAFLPALGRRLHAGYGMATLAWWAARGALPADARAATIHGFLAACWCGLERSPIDPTDAQAWGGMETLAGVGAGTLPAAVGHGMVVGTLRPDTARRLGLPSGIPVTAPLGDNQASLRATLEEPGAELAFTLGTGCQLAAVVPRTFTCDPGHAERRPYDARHDVIVAAPLCGGAAWKWLAETARSWSADLGGAAPAIEQVYARLDALGAAAGDVLTFSPHLAGERHAPGLGGVLAGLRLDGGSLGQVARALARGIAANARDLLPAAARSGRTRVRASGNALRRSLLLREMASAELGLPVILGTRMEEAATGAALVATDAWRR